MIEIWKDIEGYEGLYQVSNLGRVKSLWFGKEKILKGGKDSSGYIFVVLSKEGKIKYFQIHRLVASAFLDNSNNLPCINHINEDKTNNRVENLEWCTYQYNNNYGTHNERMAKTKSIPILQFSKEDNFIRKWESATQVERELNFNEGNINKCCKGKQKSAYDYKWHYHYKSLWERKHIPQIKLRKVA